MGSVGSIWRKPRAAPRSGPRRRRARSSVAAQCGSRACARRRFPPCGACRRAPRSAAIAPSRSCWRRRPPMIRRPLSRRRTPHSTHEPNEGSVMNFVTASTHQGETGARKSDPLLQPLRIKKILFRNRIMSTSHASTLDEDGMPKERYQRYHEEKAKGGIALTMFGGSSMVSRDSSWGGGQVDVSGDEVIPYLRAFSERIHAHGAAIMCQISHLGRRADAMGWNWLPTVGPSPIRETRHRNFPREMDAHDIARIVKEYAAAAKRCREGGLDGVETVTGGHLIGQF